MSLYEKLYDWQKKIVDNFKNKRAYGLFLDMGLGKTPISLAFAEVNKSDKILVITINSKAIEKEDVKGSWLNWSTQMEYKYNSKSKNDKNLSFDRNEKEIMIVNYEWLKDPKSNKKEGTKVRREILDFIQSGIEKNITIICDESHKIKASNSIQTKCVQKIWDLVKKVSKDPHLYLLTGTPFTQGYIDLHTQLQLLGIDMSKTKFKDNFCIMDNRPGLYGWQQPIKAYKNVDELFDLVHKVAITMKSEEVVDLPEQNFVYFNYPQTSYMKLFTNETAYPKDIKLWLGKKLNISDVLKQESKQPNPYFRNIDYPEYNWVADTASAFWLRSRELSIGFQGNSEEYKIYDRTRFNMLKKFLEENEDNYLLFYSYTPEFIELFDIVSELGYNIDVYNGIMKTTENYDKYASLKDGERLMTKHNNIILANWSSGSTGINFQAYNKCIVFDLPVYKDWEQGIKRIHRLGQKEKCIYYMFTQDCWLDIGMWRAIKEQRDYTKDTFESDLKRVRDILEENK